MIKRIAFTVYLVKNLEASRNFYENDLGLKCTESFNDSWFEYDVGGTCFAITNYPMPPYQPGAQGSVAFEVEDIDSLVAKLESKGHRQIMDRMDAPTCFGAFFKDPDGNMVGLHQLK